MKRNRNVWHVVSCAMNRQAWAGYCVARVSAILCFLAMSSFVVHAQSVTSIDSLPYQIQASGNYVLGGDLSLDANAAAISILAGNVTLDCAGHRITSITQYPDIVAISAAVDLSDVVIRNCTVVNFDRGITAGWRAYRTRILDNQVLDGGARGITVLGHDALVSGNRVIGLRGKPGGTSEGISVREFDVGISSTNVKVLDNVVADIFGDKDAKGIVINQSTAPEIVGNTILDVRANPSFYYYSYYIYFTDFVYAPFVEGVLVRNNVMMSRMLSGAYVVDRAYGGMDNAAASCTGNVSVGFRLLNYSPCLLLDRNVDIQ